MTKPKKILLQDSDAWCKAKGLKVHDPDGWDRKNLAESWFELITEEEFETRCSSSTIQLLQKDN